MSSRGAVPARERRTHAERTAETRERVMTAVVEAISEVGFARTTASEIARRAGVTWGAVQHHYRDKDGILAAVLEDSFSRFAEALGEVPEEPELEKRVALFGDRAWVHFASPHYRSTSEILLNLPDEIESPWQQEMHREWRRIWSRYFPQSDPRDPSTVELMLYAVAVFTGLAATQRLEGRSARRRDAQLGFLKETLVGRLGRSASRG